MRNSEFNVKCRFLLFFYGFLWGEVIRFYLFNRSTGK